MNSIQEIDYSWCSGPWTTKRMEAVNSGYTQIYVRELDGRFRCLCNPGKFYKATDLIVAKTAFKGGAMLTIEPRDGGPKGTLTEYDFVY